MTTLPPNDLRAELPRATPFRHVLNGLVVELEADAVIWFLEHWTSGLARQAIAESIEATELAAAEQLAARYRLRVEWTERLRPGCWIAVLYEGDLFNDSETWPVGLTDEGRRIYAALMVLKFLRRHSRPSA